MLRSNMVSTETFVYFGVESINITPLSREHVTHALYKYMLYDDALYMLKSNKIYVTLHVFPTKGKFKQNPCL